MTKKIDSILEELLPGIRGQAYKRAMNQFQAEDFVQEALIAVIIQFKKRSKMIRSDLIPFLGTVAKNKIIDCQRHSISHHNKETDLYEWHGTVEQSNEVEIDDLFQKIFAALSPEAKQILLEKLEPSQKTERIINKEVKKRKADAKRGYLTSLNVKITNKIIGESLNLNKRQVKDAVQEIKVITIQLLSIDD